MTAIPEAFEPPSLGKACGLSVKHLPAFLVLAIVVALVGGLTVAVWMLLTYLGFGAANSIMGSSSSDPVGVGLLVGYGLGGLGAMPFLMLLSLLSVLFQAIPAVYFSKGEVITIGRSFGLIMERPWRYVWAGIVFTFAVAIGSFLCYIPGLAVAFVGPVYTNKIFNSDLAVMEAFSSSFSAVYKSEHLWPFIGIQILIGLVVSLVNLFSCGILGILFFLIIPATSFYVQNVAYRSGILT